MLGLSKMKDNKRVDPWSDVPKPAFTRNSKIYEYVLSIEVMRKQRAGTRAIRRQIPPSKPQKSDRISFLRPIPHTSAVRLGSNLIISDTKF